MKRQRIVRSFVCVNGIPQSRSFAVSLRPAKEDVEAVMDGAHIVCMHCWWHFFVQEHGWFTHGFTCGKEKREKTNEPMPILLSAVGDTVDPTCCNESLPRIAGHINECMLNLTVEALLLK